MSADKDQGDKAAKPSSVTFDISKIRPIKPHPELDPAVIRQRAEESALAMGIKLIDTMPEQTPAASPPTPRQFETMASSAVQPPKAKTADLRHRVSVPPDLFKTLLRAEIDEGRSRHTIVTEALAFYWSSPAPPKQTEAPEERPEASVRQQLARVSLAPEIYRKLRHAELDEDRSRRTIIGDALRLYWRSRATAS